MPITVDIGDKIFREKIESVNFSILSEVFQGINLSDIENADFLLVDNPTIVMEDVAFDPNPRLEWFVVKQDFTGRIGEARSYKPGNAIVNLKSIFKNFSIAAATAGGAVGAPLILYPVIAIATIYALKDQFESQVSEREAIVLMSAWSLCKTNTSVSEYMIQLDANKYAIKFEIPKFSDDEVSWLIDRLINIGTLNIIDGTVKVIEKISIKFG